MSEAEKKWGEWDRRKFLATDSYIRAHTASVQSREAYKAALRREITRQIEQAKKVISDTPPEWGSVKLAGEVALKILTEQLELLDTVEP